MVQWYFVTAAPNGQSHHPPHFLHSQLVHQAARGLLLVLKTIKFVLPPSLHTYSSFCLECSCSGLLCDWFLLILTYSNILTNWFKLSTTTIRPLWSFLKPPEAIRLFVHCLPHEKYKLHYCRDFACYLSYHSQLLRQSLECSRSSIEMLCWISLLTSPSAYSSRRSVLGIRS